MRAIAIKPHPPVQVREISVETRRKQAVALELRAKGYSFQRMADEMGLSKLYVRKLFLQAMAAIITPGVEEMRKLENERLDYLFNEAMKVLEAYHPYISSGAVVRDIVMASDGKPLLDSDGNPVTQALTDSAPRLNAIRVILQIMDRRAKMNGLDMPTKVAQTDPSGQKNATGVSIYLPQNDRDANVVSEQ